MYWLNRGKYSHLSLCLKMILLKCNPIYQLSSMYVERKVLYSALKNLVGWHAVAVSFPLSDVILAQLACP
jgi:hypothetical protein